MNKMFVKIKSMLMIMLLMMSVSSVAFAEDTNVSVSDNVSVTDANVSVSSNASLDDSADEDEEIEVVTEEEADILSTQVGAQVRMVQLKNRIEAQAETGQIIIDRIEEVDADFDVTRLEEIIDELYVFVEMIEGYDYNQDKDVLVDDYVGIKKEVIELSSEFKSIVKDVFSESDKERLRVKAQERKEAWKAKKDAKFDQLKKRYNLQRLEGLANKVGYDVESARERLESGDVTVEELREELVAAYKDLSDEDKKRIQDELKEARIKHRIQVKERKDELKAEAEERREEIRERAKERRADLKDKIEQRKEGLKQKFDHRRNSQFDDDIASNESESN